MAFTTSNVRRGTAGDLKIIAGDWAETQAGQANVTYTVEGGRVYFARFDSQDSTNGPDQEIPVFISSNAGTGTITLSIANRQIVATGRFYIVSA